MTAPPPPLRHVVTAVVSSDQGAVALVRRSARVATFAGAWGGLSGYVEPGDASTVARCVEEAREEAGLSGLAHRFAGRPFRVGGFVVHPHAFRGPPGRPPLTVNWESDNAAWVAPGDVGRPPYSPTVPRLADAVARVTPSPLVAAAVAALDADRERGAAQLAVVALEALRGEAERRQGREEGGPADAASALDAAADAAYTLACARPAMWPLAGALADALTQAKETKPATAAAAWRAVAAAATHTMDRLAADAAALTAAGVAALADATAAAPAGARVVTNSYSSSVVAVLTRAAAAAVAAGGGPLPVLVAESRPLCEGVRLARVLADAGADVQLCTDAAGPALVAAGGAAALVVGADAVTDRSVVNKAGTASLARAAADAGVPVLVVAGELKLGGGCLGAVAAGRPPPPPADEPDPTELAAAYGAGVDLTGVTLRNPYFEETPLAAVAGVVVEGGVVAGDAVAARARAGAGRVAAAFGLDWV